MKMLAIIVSLLGGLGVLIHSQVKSAEGRDASQTLDLSLAGIAGRYSYAPELCDYPDMIVEITNYAVDYSEALASADIKFESIDMRVASLPITGETPILVGVWKTPNAEVRTSLFSTLSQSDLTLLELRPSQSTTRDVVSYTVYDFDGLAKFDTFYDWAPKFIEGYALYPCDHGERSSASVTLPS